MERAPSVTIELEEVPDIPDAVNEYVESNGSRVVGTIERPGLPSLLMIDYPGLEANDPVEEITDFFPMHHILRLRRLGESEPLSESNNGYFSDIELYSSHLYYVMMSATDSYMTELLRKHYPNDRTSRFDDDDDSFADTDSMTGNILGDIRDAQVEIQGNGFDLEVVTKETCEICTNLRALTTRSCCGHNVCNECLAAYIADKVESSAELSVIECPTCKKSLSQTEIKLRLKYSLFHTALDLYYKRIREISLKPNEYLCPNCACILTTPATVLSLPFKLKENDLEKLQLSCFNCGFVTCAKCRSPWHAGQTCKEYRKGDQSMLKWADGPRDSRNATKCPGCKRWYQRSEGCNHMTCSKCKTEFFYDCGCRCYPSLSSLNLWFLSHTTKLSIIGCRNIFLKRHNLLRKAIRGSLFATGVTIATPFAIPIAVISLILFLGFLAIRGLYRAVKDCL